MRDAMHTCLYFKLKNKIFKFQEMIPTESYSSRIKTQSNENYKYEKICLDIGEKILNF